MTYRSVTWRRRFLSAALALAVLPLTAPPVDAQDAPATILDIPTPAPKDDTLLPNIVNLIIRQMYRDDTLRVSQSAAEEEAMRGLLLAMFGARARGIQELERAVVKDPYFGFAHYTLSKVQAIEAHTVPAIASLTRALELDRKYAAMAAVDPDLKALRETAEYIGLMERFEAGAIADKTALNTPAEDSYVFSITAIEEFQRKGFAPLLSRMSFSEGDILRSAGKAAAEFDSRVTVADGKNPYARRLSSVTKTLKVVGERKLDFKAYLVPSAEALSFADGSIRVSSGLMDVLDDDELLAVLGHEIGHVVLGHRAKQAVLGELSRRLTDALVPHLMENAIQVVPVSTPVRVEATKRDANTLAMGNVSQTLEAQADDYSVEFLIREGKDPLNAVSALLKLEALESGEPSAKPPALQLHAATPSIGRTRKVFTMASHLPPGERAVRLRQKIERTHDTYQSSGADSTPSS